MVMVRKNVCLLMTPAKPISGTNGGRDRHDASLSFPVVKVYIPDCYTAANFRS